VTLVHCRLSHTIEHRHYEDNEAQEVWKFHTKIFSSTREKKTKQKWNQDTIILTSVNIPGTETSLATRIQI